MAKELVDYDALAMVEANPFYRKFLLKKQEILEKYTKKLERQQKRRNLFSKNKQTPAVEFNFETETNQDEYFFLCFMTKRFFRDNTIISLLKILFGIAAVCGSIFMEEHYTSNALKAPLMVILFAYGLIMIPLSILYAICNFICYLRSDNYVSTVKSRLAQQIIHFYDENTDKFMAVNLGSLLGIGKAFREKRRIRGW